MIVKNKNKFRRCPRVGLTRGRMTQTNRVIAQDIEFEKSYVIMSMCVLVQSLIVLSKGMEGIIKMTSFLLLFLAHETMLIFIEKIVIIYEYQTTCNIFMRTVRFDQF